MKFIFKSIFVLLLCAVFLNSCADVRQKTLENMAKQADFSIINFYSPGGDSENPISFQVGDPAEIDKLVTFATAQNTEEFKCGYTGSIELMRNEILIFEMEFNLDENCRHIVYTTVDQTYFSAISLEGISYLQEKEERAIIQFDALEDIRRMDWLLGKWSYVTKRVAFYEEWNLGEDGRMTGKGESREQKEDPIVEELTIEARNGDIYYVAKTSVNEKPISFLLTEQTDSLLVFENPVHDMPKRISYQRQADGILHAWIEGDASDGLSRMDFHFVIQTVIEE